MPRRTFWRNEPNAFQLRDVISLTPRAPPPLPGSAPPILAVENVQKGCHAGTPEWPPPGAPNPCQKGQTCRTGQIVRYLNRTSRVLATATLAAPCGNRFAKLIGCCWTLRPRGCPATSRRRGHASDASHTGLLQRQISVRSGGKR
jgi:hypothetical protein